MKAKSYSDQKNWSDVYLTDPKLIEVLGSFDTDPCCPENMPWVTAGTMYTLKEDGLSQFWSGRIFMNPPYRNVMRWAEKFINSNSGVALLNGRSTETKATQLIMNKSYCMWFPLGRLTFYRLNGQAYEQKWFSSLLLGLTVGDYTKLKKARNLFGGTIFIKDFLK